MKVLIIEDEPAAARRLAKLVHEIDEQTEVVDSLDSVDSAVHWFEQNKLPDLIFLDIHLADGSSFEIFNRVHVEKPIIFTTAYDQYAIQAFKVQAIDYLLKPIKKEELHQAIQKYKKWSKPGGNVNFDDLAKALHLDGQTKRFLIRFGQTIRVVELGDVAFFYTQDKITFLTTKEGKRYPIDYSLEKVEDLMDNGKFFRINRQFIVNVDAIKEMHAYSKSRVKLMLNPNCDMDTVVSTERSPVFKKWLVGE
ncbi:MAG: LytTR family DNA-binding domain-containing protein [Bacteroidota bacterium]